VSKVASPTSAYRLPLRVRFHECDPLGHVNNAVYPSWLEQAAIDHAALVGWSQEVLEREAGGVFVARRHEIDYLRPAHDGDHLEVLTWADSMQMVTALRRYVIRRASDAHTAPELIDQPDVAAFGEGEVLVRAVTRWALIRRDTMRPMRIPKRVIDDFVTPREPMGDGQA
jgi:acyl-CoA thioester hydrolase